MRALLLAASTAAAVAIDLALSANAAAWIQHSVVGGPSFDAFTFAPGNPIYVGTPPRAWVVNGFIYEVNASTWCILAGQYPAGYWDG